MKKKQQTLARIAAIVGILGGILGIVAAFSDSNPTFSWIALCIVIIALAWYFAEGFRATLISAVLGLVAVAAIGVALWLGPVTVEITVYIDQNGNGIQDGGEPAVGPGMDLELLDSSGIIHTAITDERGIATFPDVPQGPYGLQLGAPGVPGTAGRFNVEYRVPISPTPISPTATVTPLPIPTETQTATPTETVLPTSTPQCSDDLVSCSESFATIFTPGESSLEAFLVSGNLMLNFRNERNGTGVAFKFAPPLDVRGFGYLELTGTSVENCTFVIEYKIWSGEELTIVKTSGFKTFDGAAATTQNFRIPMAYNGEIDEIVINFYDKGEASTVVIESLRLSQ